MYADKYQSFLQAETLILGVHSHTCPKYQSNKLSYLCNTPRKT